MINSLRIKNLAIIEEMEVDFNEGFNVITGETGSGKTIFLNAIQLLLSNKTIPSDFIRHGEESCEIEALFTVGNEEIVVRKEFFLSGRTKAFIDNRFSSQTKLRDTVKELIEFSGQNENQILFHNDFQLELLDSFGALGNMVDEYRESYLKYRSLLSELKKLKEKKSNIEEKKNFYQFHLELIENMKLDDEDEEKKLVKEIEYAENIEKIKENINFVYYEISGKENSIIKRIGEIKERISEISDFKQGFSNVLQIINEVEINLEEAGKFALNEVSSIIDENYNLSMLYERVNGIKNLKKKLNKNSVAEIIKYREEIIKILESLENFDINMEHLKNEIDKLKKTVDEKAKRLSDKRAEVKLLLEKEVASHLNELKMNNVTFNIAIEKNNDFTENGIDKISFLISTNKGEPLKPLQKIASGGELSRIMLALKSILSEFLKTPILIFDEIDTGTGGETSYAIGKKIGKIAENHQVIVITHLPQVAAFASTHYKIYKENRNNRVFSNIKKLDNNERLLEIARMLSGEKITDKAVENAKEILSQAKCL